MRDEEYRAMFDLEERFWWHAGMRAATASILGRGQKVGPRVLDVGCGTGFTLLWLREQVRCDEAFGIDASPHAAALWQLRGLDTTAVASTDSLPFASGEFDLVTCFDVIYQFEPSRGRAAVAEMYRVLKPGGWVFIREPAYNWIWGAHDVAVGTCHRYTRAELRRVLTGEGFTIARATYLNTLLFWLAVPHRLVSRIRRSRASDVSPAPRVVNSALAAVLKVEARLLRAFNLPFGLSVAALAQKKK